MVSKHNQPGDNPTGSSPMLGTGVSRRGFVQGIFGVGLVAAAGSALAACGNDDSGNSNKPVADDAAVKGGPKTTPVSGIPYPDGYVGPIASKKGPIVASGKQVKLKVAVLSDPGVGDWKNNEFSKWYEKQTGVQVEYQVIPVEESMTKVNAMIASGDLPDVFLRMDFTPAQLALYGQQGLILPLNDLIDQYGVETKRIFKDYPDAKTEITSNDGKIYTLPNVNDCFHCRAWNNRLWINQAWLDKLGLEMPTTPEEFEAVLEAFKTKDPNGNGKADEIPLMTYNDSGDPGSQLDSFIMSAFLYNPGGTTGKPWVVVNDGKVDVVYNKDGWRQGLIFLNRLYKKGLLPKESFTQNMEQFGRIGQNAGGVTLGAAKGGTWFVFTTIDDKTEVGKRWKDYVCVPALKGPDGTQVASWDYYGATTAGNFVITRACKNPAVALMWGDGQYELETILRAYSGPKDENWRWAKAGEKGINGKQALWSSLTRADGKTEGLGWNQFGISYRSNDFRLGERVDPKAPTFEQPLYEQTAKAYYPYRQPQEQQLPPLYMTEAQAGTSSELETTLANHVRQSLTKFTMGELDPNKDADWKQYTDTIDQMGLANYLQTFQEAYDAKYK
jgi:putative aldouronate transport system substrate-binding protein